MNTDNLKIKIFFAVEVVLALLLIGVLEANISSFNHWSIYFIFAILYLFYLYILYLAYEFISNGEIARAYFFAVGLFFVFALSFVGACAIGSFDLNINPPR